jgi:hypothetical protein
LKKSYWWSGSMCKCIKTRFWWSLSMCKCIKTRFYPFQTVKNIFFEKSFLVFSKYAQMHQNTFLTTSDSKKYFFFFKKFLVVWKYAQMHQNTFSSTPDGQKNIFWRNVSGGLEMCANALKHVFNPLQTLKNIFSEKSYWWSVSMCKCIKTFF